MLVKVYRYRVRPDLAARFLQAQERAAALYAAAGAIPATYLRSVDDPHVWIEIHRQPDDPAARAALGQVEQHPELPGLWREFQATLDPRYPTIVEEFSEESFVTGKATGPVTAMPAAQAVIVPQVPSGTSGGGSAASAAVLVTPPPPRPSAADEPPSRGAVPKSHEPLGGEEALDSGRVELIAPADDAVPKLEPWLAGVGATDSDCTVSNSTAPEPAPVLVEPVSDGAAILGEPCAVVEPESDQDPAEDMSVGPSVDTGITSQELTGEAGVRVESAPLDGLADGDSRAPADEIPRPGWAFTEYPVALPSPAAFAAGDHADEREDFPADEDLSPPFELPPGVELLTAAEYELRQKTAESRPDGDR